MILNILYKLIGIVLHSGKPDKGHYTYLSYSVENNNWYWFNDSLVQSYSMEDVTIFSGDNKAQLTNIATHLVYVKQHLLRRIYNNK